MRFPFTTVGLGRMTHPVCYVRPVTYRTFFPDRPPTHYRILVPMPLKVRFPSVTKTVLMQVELLCSARR
jgi:hypothetical protein